MSPILAAGLQGRSAPLEPIAIVGIGCRFPGGVHDPQSFWRLLHDGVDAIGAIPSSRFDLDCFYDARPGQPGKVMTRWGGFLADIDRFDAGFFGISPREADRLDPQQRLLLEVAWEALEDAGQCPLDPVREGWLQDTGVFVGVWLSDYEACLFHDPSQVDFHMTTGSGRYSAAGRLSYTFDFQGPSLTVDTACSSSLVAVHLACQSLRNRECNLALAGGANVILQPHITIAYSQSRMMAPDGRCKFGDAAADGYVRSEGAAVIALKRLADALADGDPIYAVIRGSAINNDGRSSGSLAAPGAAGQEDLLRKAYRNAGVLPGQVQYVEAHGTGTRAGDPVELAALGRVLAEGRPAAVPCRVGSVKTNLGHTEGAAGIAGLIKVALSLKHGVLPASLHFQTPNPDIPWEQLSLFVQAQQSPWPEHAALALAGVSAFGIAGTNAHVVLEEAPAPHDAARALPAGRPEPAHLLGLSARTPEALAAVVERWRALLDTPGVPALADLCFTAGVRRTHHAERAAFVATTPEELAAQLADFRPAPTQPVPGAGRKVVFVFPGQGSQWLGMGQSLLAVESVFRAALETCERALRPHVDWSLLDELAAPPERSRLGEIGVVQPVLFAVQVALAALWRAWGVEPDAVIGHSLGEVAAAHVAGALSLEDAAAVICTRSQLMQEVSGQGAMLAVELPLAQAQQAAGAWPSVSIAVSNSSRSTVLAGDPGDLAALERNLSAQEVFCRFVKVDVAAHSPQMEPLRPRLEQLLEHVQPAPAQTPLYSTVTGARWDGDALDAAYWGRNLRQPVLFAAAVQAALADGCNTFIEISPHPVLTTAIDQVATHLGPQTSSSAPPAPGPQTSPSAPPVPGAQTSSSALVLPSCRRQEDERASLLRSLGDLYVAGYPVDWARLHPGSGRCVSLPAYPWQRERYWYDNIPGFVGVEQHRPAHSLSDEPAPALPRVGETDHWLWQLDWQPQPLPVAPSDTPARADAAGTWLILADRDGVGEALAARVQEAGGDPILVYAGEETAAPGPQRYSANPVDPASLQALFAQLFPQRQPHCRAVIHLWGSDAAAGHAAPGAALASALHLVQAVAQRTWAQAPKLWFVTRGAQTPAGAPHRPAALDDWRRAVLWGVGRVAGAEYPDLWGGLIDLDPDLPAQVAAQALWPDLLSPTGANELRFDAGTRAVSRLVPLVPSTTEQATWRWRSDAAYLITGGLGGLGLLLAGWMAEQGARRLILLGRTPLPPRSQWAAVDAGSKLGRQVAAVRRLEAKGVSVHLAAVDVGDEAQLSAWLAQYAAEGWPPIRGVVHAAAAVRFGLLANLTWADFAAVLHAKVEGAWLLHKLLPDLDFFVLFSSVAALLGQTGQGNYAAANAGLDALAHWRRSQDLPALSINWAVWDATGIAAEESSAPVTERLAQQGVGTIDPAAGFAALGRLLAAGVEPQVAVLPPVPPAPGFLPRLLRERQASATANPEVETPAPTGQEDALRSALLALEPAARRARLVAYLQGAVGQVLRMAPGRIGTAVAFGALGLDSLMALELRNRLEAALQINLPATFAWNYPTIDELLPYLAARMDIALDESAPAAALPAPAASGEPHADGADDAGDLGGLDALLAGIQELSDEGALQLLKTQPR